MLVLGVALLAALIAGCAGATTGEAPAHTATASVPSQTSTPTPITAKIADLNQFRQRLADAMASGTWDRVAPLVSPSFSFQTALDFPDPQRAGKLILAPDGADAFRTLYASAGKWSENDGVRAQLGCYSGGLPAAQLLGFSDTGSDWLLVGFDRWQGYWLVTWAYQDSTGAEGRCL